MTDRAGTQRDSQVARRRRAVSLVEVLIVVGIVLLLFAMLFPGLAHARESARRVMC
ncbi:MAG: type II secretion system protein, partial [Planctomycetes bacterium]|nr:type II secretion system protein [Planctomycetota bacterium]